MFSAFGPESIDLPSIISDLFMEYTETIQPDSLSTK